MYTHTYIYIYKEPLVLLPRANVDAVLQARPHIYVCVCVHI